MHFKINKKSKETQCIGSAYTTTNQKKVLKMLIFKLNILFQKSKNYLKLKLNIKSEKKKNCCFIIGILHLKLMSLANASTQLCNPTKTNWQHKVIF